jgi:hypothetical protein
MEKDEFLFETSHLALRSNTDYLVLLRHLSHLTSLRIRFHNDIKLLSTAHQKALSDPQAFVNKLIKGSLDLPDLILIPEVITILF